MTVAGNPVAFKINCTYYRKVKTILLSIFDTIKKDVVT